MARTKNRGIDYATSPYTKLTPTWRLGKYLRLSKDDFKRGNTKDNDKEKLISDSIENQRKILNAFEQASVDEFEYSDEYKDDGFTGTDADRDDFQRLLADVRSGKINCVVVKDLSRLSRDYVEAGILIDRLFVQMNVRFISLHERIDSYNDPDSISNMVVPITNSIKHNRLEAAVLYAIQQQVYLAVSYSDMLSRINMAPLKKSQSARLDGLIAEKEKELAKITRYKQALYEDWKDGDISHKDYRQMREDYEQQVATISAVIEKLTTEQSEIENGVDTENLFLSTFRKYENIDKLTREILIELIDHIKVYEGGDISIKFKFADEYRRVAEYIEVNKQKEAV